LLNDTDTLDVDLVLDKTPAQERITDFQVNVAESLNSKDRDFKVDLELKECKALVAHVLTTDMVPYSHTLNRSEPPQISVTLPLHGILQLASPSGARVPPLEMVEPQ
jgi:hypothetical protein